jgi:hypothetical protein
MSGSKLSEQFVHPLIVGALGYAGAYIMGEGVKEVVIGGMSLSLPLFMGVTTGVSSAVGETLKQWVLPMLPNNVGFTSLENTFLAPALVGGVDGLSMYILTRTRFMEGFILGGGSEILGSYLYDGIIRPYTMNMKY